MALQKNVSVAEFEQMVSLAEKISGRAIELVRERQLIILRGIIIFVVSFFVFLVLSVIMENYWPFSKSSQLSVLVFLGAGTVVLWSILFFIFVDSLKENKKEMNIEKAILKDLMTMLFEAQNLVNVRLDIDSVSYALLDIRLKRVSFSQSF